MAKCFREKIEHCGQCPNKCTRYDVSWCHAMTNGPIHYHLPDEYAKWKDTPIPDWCPLNDTK